MIFGAKVSPSQRAIVKVETPGLLDVPEPVRRKGGGRRGMARSRRTEGSATGRP